MKRILLFIAILCANSSFSQKEAFLYGEWKIVSLDDGDFYINAKNDSISVYSELKDQYSTPEKKETLIKNAKKLYLNNRFVFEKNGISKQIFAYFGVVSSTYKIDYERKKILVTSKNSLEKDVTEAYDYDFNKNLLYLTIPMENKPMKLVLEKINQ